MSGRTIEAIGTPSIEACPDCGNDRLVGTTVTVNTSILDLDGSGGVALWNDDMLQDALVVSLECNDCGVVLVEDGEVVHEEVDA